METVNLPKRRILFTPGPLTTSKGVKAGMLCEDQSPRDPRFMRLLRDVRTRLARVVGDPEHYHSVLLNASGTGAVEAMLLAAARPGKPLLIINNGAYGQRMCAIAEAYRLPYRELKLSPLQAIDLPLVEKAIKAADQGLSALLVVHHETTTGLLNDIDALGQLCHRYHIPLAVDAMSSYGALEIDMQACYIKLLAASSNKNIQGMPGVGLVVLERTFATALSQYQSPCFYLDCIAEWLAQENSGQGRFTLPVQIIQSLALALEEFEAEGRAGRLSRYQHNWRLLSAALGKMGFAFLLPNHLQSQLILSVLEPKDSRLSFRALSAYMSERGIDIYPGKLPGYHYFRLCTVGDLYEQDIHQFITELKAFIAQQKTTLEAV